MIRLIILLYLTLFFLPAIAQEKELNIGLFCSSDLKEISIQLDEHSYIALQTRMKIWGTRKRPSFQIKAKGNKVEIFQSANFLGELNQLECIVMSGSSILLKPLLPSLKGNRYTGKLLIRSQNGSLKLINKLFEQDYLSGVLRGEVGYDKPNSLYQVHAILSRTYARFYKDRHRSEGFELCDQTHCQVFKGYFDYLPYSIAIKSTQNKVVIDSLNADIVELLFHSNCGGQTSASEDVWKSNLIYCRSILDTFCLSSKQARWQKHVTLEAFCSKLNINIPIDIESKNSLCDAVYSYNIMRTNSISIGDKIFKTTDIRFRLDLKSAWFDLDCKDDSVHIYGKGFGHGVGMCQEGAIKMAELGFTPIQIIKHYYKGVVIAEKP